MIIDFHTHAFPARIAPSTIDKLSRQSHSAAFTDGTPDGLRAAMARAGVTHSVILPVATNPLKVSAVNDISLSLNGQGGLIYFGCIHPEAPNWHEELSRIAAGGLKGIKIHPIYQNADIDSPAFLRILTRAGELGLTVVTHAGDDIGFPGATQSAPEKIASALRQAGPLRLVLAHMGGWRVWRRAAELLSDSGAYIDTSFSLGAILPIEDGHYAAGELELMDEAGFLSIIRQYGSGRVLFGSDAPWDSQQHALEGLLALPLTEEEREDILWRNAAGLLGLGKI